MTKFPELRFRQVHLDFHTSEHIEEIGAKFDEEQFIGALKKGHVNSITLFAMCHHGWSYYDTKVGKTHPHLKTDLLSRMLKACKEADIEAPVYITAGWNERMADEHPDWLRLDKEGKLQNMPAPGKPDDARPWGWRTLCFNTPYVDFLCEVAKEVVSKYDPVGIFFDITFDQACYCKNCVNSMVEAGLDPKDEAAAGKFQRQVYVNYLKKTSQAVWSLNPRTRIFHNGGLNRRACDDFYPYYSHFEIESLPTGVWGYDHYPLNAKYFLSRGMDFLGMTGKFHQFWGEFGGFKGPNALKFECLHMLSLGSKCSVGDQLHPSGRMDEDTYRIIGEA
ncbi:MAG: alpha-L-fucosidase, partial [Lentisphaerota bacterium]